MRMLIRMDWQVNCTIRMRIGETREGVTVK